MSNAKTKTLSMLMDEPLQRVGGGLSDGGLCWLSEWTEEASTAIERLAPAYVAINNLAAELRFVIEGGDTALDEWIRRWRGMADTAVKVLDRELMGKEYPQ